MKKVKFLFLIFLSFFSSRYFSFIFLILLILFNKYLGLNFLLLSLLNLFITYFFKKIINKKRKIKSFLHNNYELFDIKNDIKTYSKTQINKKFNQSVPSKIYKLFFKFIIPDNYSFPSGHSSNSIILIFFFILCYPFLFNKNELIYLIFYNHNFLNLIKLIKINAFININFLFYSTLIILLFFLSSFSRFMLKIHEIKDIIAGYFVGFINLIIFVIFYDKIFLKIINLFLSFIKWN